MQKPVKLPVIDPSPELEADEVLLGDLRGAVDLSHPMGLPIRVWTRVDVAERTRAVRLVQSPAVAALLHLLVLFRGVEDSGVGTKEDSLRDGSALLVDNSFPSPFDEASGDLEAVVSEGGELRRVNVAPINLQLATWSAEDGGVHVLQILLHVVDSAPRAEELRVAVCSSLPPSTAVPPAPPPTGLFIAIRDP